MEGSNGWGVLSAAQSPIRPTRFGYTPPLTKGRGGSPDRVARRDDGEGYYHEATGVWREFDGIGSAAIGRVPLVAGTRSME